jgi:hypothetical protein
VATPTRAGQRCSRVVSKRPAIRDSPAHRQLLVECQLTDYLTSHSTYHAGVYSAPGVWKSIFGTGTSSILSNTYEWTYTGDTSSLTHHPVGWCLSGTTTCAQFFGGRTSTSKYALMWQWSGGGGTHNGYGDFDQIDAARSIGSAGRRTSMATTIRRNDSALTAETGAGLGAALIATAQTSVVSGKEWCSCATDQRSPVLRRPRVSRSRYPGRPSKSAGVPHRSNAYA